MRTVIGVLVGCLVACTAGCTARKAAPLESRETGPGPGQEPGREAGTLVIGSYNVLYSLAEKKEGVEPSRWADPATVRHIAGLGADVMLFQETNEAWEGAIRAALGQKLPHCAFHRPKRYLPEGLGVCARFPLEGDTLLPSPLQWFPAQRVRVRAPDGDLEVLNVHLRPAVAGPKEWWKVHEETRPLRKQEIDAYLPRLSAGAPIVVGGDFNDIHEGDLFTSLKAAGLDSAFARAGQKAVTWRWPGLSPPLEAQLDHVTFDASAFELVSAKVVPGGNSDHFAMLVTLRRSARRLR